MIYDIRHLTTYEYGAPVSFSRCALRVLPSDGPGQAIVSTRVDIDPAPSDTKAGQCFFGNRLTKIAIESPHRTLKVDARTVARIERDPPPAAGLTPPWEAVRENAFAASSLAPDSPAHFLHASRLVPRFAPAADYARGSFGARTPVLAGAAELMDRIHADFRYDPKATVVSTPLSEAFEKRRGVCQDFAHVMIAALRGIGLPAAYVSGYLRTRPPEGKPRLEGADASHAWVAVWCGPAPGWVGLDPTNAMTIGDDHIILARGRDYADVSPISGIILGSQEQSVEVKVDVVPRGQS